MEREQPGNPPGRAAASGGPDPHPVEPAGTDRSGPAPEAEGPPAAGGRSPEAYDESSQRPDEPAAVVAPPDPDVPPPAHTGQIQPVPGRSERSAKDMAISLLVLLVPIALVLVFVRVVLDGDEPVRVDPAPAIAEARAARAFPVSEPADLDGWRPVSAAFQSADGGRTLRIGYISREGRGIQLVQSNVPAERLLPAELTSNGQAQGFTEVAGRDWQRYTARPGERALVLLEEQRTVIIVGDAAEGELRSLAGSLR